MGLTDSIRRLVGGGEEEPGPAYECSTCGRAYETERSVCVDCNGHVREASAG
jgi:uncharacterized OB-fold protein